MHTPFEADLPNLTVIVTAAVLVSLLKSGPIAHSIVSKQWWRLKVVDDRISLSSVGSRFHYITLHYVKVI